MIKLYSKLNEVQNLGKVTKSLYIFLTTPDRSGIYAKMMQCNQILLIIVIYCYDVEILNLFDAELRLIKIKLMIKNKLKEFLSELKKLEVQTILVLDYKK